MVFLVTVKISARVLQIQESLAFVNLPFNRTSRYRGLFGASKCQSSCVPDSPQGKSGCQRVSPSFRLALKNFLLVAGFLPGPDPYLLRETQMHGAECICIPSASPVGTDPSSGAVLLPLIL